MLMTKSERLNLAATVIGPILVSGMILWAGWSLNAKIELSQAAQDKAWTEAMTTEHQFVTQNYVSQSWFENSQKNTNSRLDTIDKSLADIRVNVAGIAAKVKADP